MRYFNTIIFSLLLASRSIAHTECKQCDLEFIENKGQWSDFISYKSSFGAGQIYFLQNGLTYNLCNLEQKNRVLHFASPADTIINFHAYNLSFNNFNQQVKLELDDIQTEYHNFMIGSDKSKWVSKAKSGKKVIYRDIYEGIDAEFYSVGIGLKYDLYVKPGAYVKDISLTYNGIDDISLNKGGDLVLKTSFGELIEQRPYAYQIINGVKQEVKCKYLFDEEKNELGFWVASYDQEYTLIIDPTLIFSTYSGSTADNFGYTATYDENGNGYTAGSVFGVGYPTTLGAYQINFIGGPTLGGGIISPDIAITKYNTNGTSRLYSTYLGGFGTDLPHSLVVNQDEEMYLLGTTSSANFPTTSSSYDTSFNGGVDPGYFNGIAAHYRTGSDIVVSKFSADGTQLLASTFLGGTGNDGINYNGIGNYNNRGTTRYNYADEVRGEIDIDLDGNILIASCTHSTDFPTTSGTFQSAAGGSMDACFTKFKPDLDTIIWSTTFGGSGDDACYSVAIGINNDLYLTGGTVSTDMPMPGAGRQKTLGGATDGFVYHITDDGATLLNSTYHGFASYDQNYFVEVNRTGEVVVFGQCENSQFNFIFNALYNRPNAGQFVTKFTPNLASWVWSTSFGRGLGVTDISPTAFLVDVCNSIYLSGWGSQSVNDNVQAIGGTQGLDVTAGCTKCTTDNQDFYLMVMREDASGLVYATFLGGNISSEHVDGGTSRFDRKGVVYQSVCAGCGRNSDFPTFPANCVSPTNNSQNCNNLLYKFDLDIPTAIADFIVPTGCNLVDLQFSNRSKEVGNDVRYFWNFGDGSSSTAINPFHAFPSPGTYDVKLLMIDSSSCNLKDSITKRITILANTASVLPTVTLCPNVPEQIGLSPDGDPNSVYTWIPPFALTDPAIANPFTFTNVDTNYLLLYSHENCVDTFRQRVTTTNDSLIIDGGTILCASDPIKLGVQNTNASNTLSYTWSPTSFILSGANTDTPIVAPIVDTYFIVQATDTAGCIYRDSVLVRVISQLGNITAIAIPDTINYKDTSQITATLSSSISAFQWRNDSTLSATNITDPRAFPLETTTYFLEASDTLGCTYVTSVRVVVLRTPCNRQGLYVPNAFTPNTDAKNDKWFVRGNDIREIKIAVYDRWGQRVFYTEDINEGWDGKFNGTELDPSVFGWYIEGECVLGDRFSFKGNLTLLK